MMNMGRETGYVRRLVPEPGHVIEMLNTEGRTQAVTWVADVLGYSMNGCFRVKDRAGRQHLVTRSRNSRMVVRWRTVG
jgi:hypothetical protein